MQDYEWVVVYYCQYEVYEEVLVVFVCYCDFQFFYKFLFIFICYIFCQFVDVWIEMGSWLDVCQFIFVLVNYSQGGEVQQVSQVICYMEFCVNVLGEIEQVIYNYLLLLYVCGWLDLLLVYLEQVGVSFYWVYYDFKYVLWFCVEYGYYCVCVYVYKVLELYEEVVDLVLQVDVDLVKQCVDLFEEDEELCKKLWLKIVWYVVQEEEDVQIVMVCLVSCFLFKIEDVLFFFFDFVIIDYFKEVICSLFKVYNYYIQELQWEMEEVIVSVQCIW